MHGAFETSIRQASLAQSFLRMSGFEGATHRAVDGVLTVIGEEGRVFEGPSLRLGFAGGGVQALRGAPFGVRYVRPPFDLRVDLGRDLFSGRWWRGLGTLLALCTGVALLAPDLGPLPGGRQGRLDEAQALQWQAVGIAPLGSGSATGLPMAETALVEPLASAPTRTSVELFATLGAGDDLAALLQRSGAGGGEAAVAAGLVAGAAPRLAPGTSLSLTLGQSRGDGTRTLERLALRAGFGMRLRVERVGGVLTLVRLPLAVDPTPLRLRGRVDAEADEVAAAAVAEHVAHLGVREAVHARLDLDVH